MTEPAWDPAEFEKEWVKLNEEVINHLMANPEIESIKEKVRQQGHVALEDRDRFIVLVNKIKYDRIYEKYGEDGSEGYAQFLKAWQHWQKLKGHLREKPQNMYEDNISHLLYGSTPDPDRFLKDFDLNSEMEN